MMTKIECAKRNIVAEGKEFKGASKCTESSCALFSECGFHGDSYKRCVKFCKKWLRNNDVISLLDFIRKDLFRIGEDPSIPDNIRNKCSDLSCEIKTFLSEKDSTESIEGHIKRIKSAKKVFGMKDEYLEAIEDALIFMMSGYDV